MAQVLSAHGAVGPGFKILLDLFSDHALRNRSQFGVAVSRCRQRHASTRAALKREETMGCVAGRELPARALHRWRICHGQVSPSNSLDAERLPRETPRLRTMAMASPTSSQERG